MSPLRILFETEEQWDLSEEKKQPRGERGEKKIIWGTGYEHREHFFFWGGGGGCEGDRHPSGKLAN